MIEIKHLKTLLALRNSGSLAGAAAALHQTQSALSHQFSDLEQRLGFRLFVRKSQPLRFTAQGEIFAAASTPGAAANHPRPAGL
ncbi:Cyn operon transcriptional activator [Raoultella terrigena]|uniref:HTH-type transcriptional regulator MetR n=1 Tax=Raoultella terrigena TaxID=577 RepID=A0A4U9D6L3_RAOTE|nr:Cyn operon transcriptional activator [Raoultella terrigena]